MKNFTKLFLLLILISFMSMGQAFAMQFEYVIGGVTPHLVPPPNNNLCGEIGAGSGIIFNKTNSYRIEEGNFGGGALVGENSYCQPIWGATAFYNIHNSRSVQINATVGFYHFDTKGFDFSEGAYFAHVDNFYFVPIAGIEVNFNIYDSKSYHIKMMNLITPVISNHSVAINFDI